MGPPRQDAGAIQPAILIMRLLGHRGRGRYRNRGRISVGFIDTDTDPDPDADGPISKMRTANAASAMGQFPGVQEK